MRSTPGIILFWGLVFGMAFSVYAHWRADKRDRVVMRTLREVHTMLCIWAETWPDPVIRERQLRALEHERERAREA